MNTKRSSRQYSRLESFDFVLDDRPQLTKKRKFPSISSRRSKGWRTAVRTCAASASTVFVVNLLSLVWAVAANGRPQGGRQILYEGDCARVRKLNVGIHLLINTLSTILLSSSNYCMQCLCAPTRLEVDAAHSKKRWLDIGIPSMRNLRFIDRKRVVLWVLLGATSLPLHLFYNSAVFSSISAYDFPIAAVNEAWTRNQTHSLNMQDPVPGRELLSGYHPKVNYYNFTQLAPMLANEIRGDLQTLSNSDCITAYAQDYVTSRGTLFLVVDDSVNASLANTPAYFGAAYLNANSDIYCAMDAYSWICTPQWSACLYGPGLSLLSAAEADDLRCSNHIKDMLANTSDWRPLAIRYPVKHCLSRQLPEHCRLQFSIHIGILVVVLNLAKAVLMVMVAFRLSDAPLMNIGDAIASFLRRPDPVTKHFGLTSKNDVQAAFNLQGIQEHAPPRCFTGKRRRVGAAPSKKRWAVMIILLLTAIAIVASLYIFAVKSLASNGILTTVPALASLGLASVTPATIISGWLISSEGVNGLIQNVLVANSPQIILSLIYFMYNGVFTTMFTAFEYNKYSYQRRGLRVSEHPAGAQRSTYFLQLPYKIAFPMMGLSGLLHWLVSQSIFLVAIEKTQLFEDGYPSSTLSCGFSPIAMFAVLFVAVGMLLILIGTGFIQLKKGAPLAASCSAAISAACHPVKAHSDAEHAERKVQWGVEGFDDNVGHTSFSSGEVYPPLEGAYYT